ncbi:hypothetical protein [Dietzia sp. CH92]|uniref:hypothetical protein n=1 Tax=Dietzia sp. CH92 TaxID=3051823 RepID=UPI0028D67F6D|nr:hypothetical protein [Dietzia sp. CH92]
MIAAFDAHVKKYGERSLAEGPLGELDEKLGGFESDPTLLGRIFSLSPDGQVIPADADGVELVPGQNDPLVAPGGTLRWDVPAPTGYNAGAFVLCYEVNSDATDLGDLFSYAEYLSTGTSGGGGLLGSLDAGGSLGSLTGSLGS